MIRTARLALLGAISALVLPAAIAVGAPSPSTATAEPGAVSTDTLGLRPSGGFLDASRLDQFERELGTDVRWYVAMAGRQSVADMRGSVHGQLIARGAVLPTISDRMNLVMSVPLAFGQGSARDQAGRNEIAGKLTETANGAWDGDFRLVAQKLVEGGYPDAVIRLGHEFTGSWYPWSAQGNADEYVAAYRHVHQVMSDVSSEFRFEWNAARNTFEEYGPPAYPGDDVVDVVGLDVYYEPWKGDPDVYDDGVWRKRYLPILESHRDFAVAHNKPVSYAEWAVGGTDEPAFLDSMYDWFAGLPEQGPGRLLYHAYFSPDKDLYDLEARPATMERFVELFGVTDAQGRAPATTQPATTTTTTAAPAATTPPTNGATVASQRLLFDHEGTQTPDDYWEPAADQPADYTSPADFADGHAYLKLDVIAKPSDKPMIPQLCFWRHTESTKFKFETCSTGRNDIFTSEGTYWLDLGAPGGWWKKNGVYDWSKQASVVRIMFKDPETKKLFMASKCGATCYPGDDLLDHVPVTYRAQVVLVASGAHLQPPAGWDGCPASFGPACDGSTSGPPTATTVPTAPSTTAPSAPDPGGTSGPILVGVPSSLSAPLDERFTIDTSIVADTIRWKKITGPSMLWIDDESPDPIMVFRGTGVHELLVRAKSGDVTAATKVLVTVGADEPPTPSPTTPSPTTPSATTTSTTTTTIAPDPGGSGDLVVDVPARFEVEVGERFEVPARIPVGSVVWDKISGGSMAWSSKRVANPIVKFNTPGERVLTVRVTHGDLVDSRTVVIDAIDGADGGLPSTNPPATNPPTTNPPTTNPANRAATSLSVRSVSAFEGQNLVFKLVLSEPVDHPVVLDVATSDISGTADVDYMARQGRLVIPAGSVRAWFGVPTIDDRVVEGVERLRLSVTDIEGAELDIASGVGSIVD